MKKINFLFSLFVIVLLTAQNLQAQTIFSENFNGGNPFANWVLIDNDNLTPSTATAFVTDAWVTFADSSAADSAAVSTSWYSPAGTADDYMITPMIITTASPVLEFEALALDAGFPDGYEVLISTTTPTIAGLQANPVLLSVAAENAAWTRRTINLSAYANDTIYLAWRNNSNDRNLLAIDNIEVYQAAADDAGITGLVNPVNGRCFYGTDSVFVDIQNFGSDTLSSIPLAFRVNNGPLQRDTFMSSLLPNTTATFWFQNTAVNLGNPGLYVFEIYTDLVNDGDRSNDTLLTFVLNTRQGFPYTQNFDSLAPLQTGTFLNGWSVQTSGSFTWVTQSGPTTSTATGPSGDHTTGNGIYFYTEASSPAVPNEAAALTSPCIDVSSNPTALTMDFWYHMFGADIQILFVQVENMGVWQTVDSIAGQQQTASADPYAYRSVDLSSFVAANQELRVRFITVRGASFNGDIAIDDVRFVIPNPVSVEEEVLPLSDLSIYPNPTDIGFINVLFNAEESANVELRLMDITGKVVRTEIFGKIIQGQQKIRVNTADLDKGIYFLNLRIGENQISRKISVLK